MYPIIHLGIFHISSYALFLFIGLIAFTITSIFILEKIERVYFKITNRILILSAIGFVIMGVFAFLFNSLFHSIKQGTIVLGGITWLGGVIGSFPLMILLMHKFCPHIKGEALEHFDLLIPGIVLAHGFGRIGCFLGGCCYGKQSNSFWGISFPAGSPAADQYPSPTGESLPVLPTQLYEALFEFLLFIVMIILYKKLKYRFLETYCLGYGVFRFLLEFLRGDNRGATGFFLSPSQVMSMILIVGGVALILYKKNIIFKELHNRMLKYQSEKEENPSQYISAKELQTLRELKSLLDDGIISQEDFDTKKEEILRRI